jgi:GTP1/Obg family GTP-binding protein
MNKTSSRLIIALAAALIVSAAPAIALSQPSQQNQEARQAVKQEFDHQTLEKYVAISVELGEIQQEVVQKLRGVKDQEKAMKIEQEAARKKISAVEDQGLDLQTFNSISNQLHVDPELRKEIEKIIEKRDS